MRRYGVLLLLWTAMALVLAGCGGGGTANVKNPPPPPSQSVSIAFQPAPPASIPVNATAQLTAVVKDDSSNAGVDWALTCTGGNCGLLSPLHTDSGKTATYTPPGNFNGNEQNVNITAFATADHTKNVVTPLTIIGFAGMLKGTYVLQSTGLDGSGYSYQFAAAITLDGNGVVTAGEQTYANTLMSVADAISGGSYSIGADGRGSLTLNTADQILGQLGVETFSFVALSSSQALIVRVDNPNLDPVTESSVGTMDLQTSKAAPGGGYAFAVSGADVFTDPLATGGILNIDSPNTISGAGSVADQDFAGSLISSAAISGTVSTPDAFGAVKFTLTAPDFSSTPMQFTGYIVDATHIKLIENDLDVNNGLGAETSGVAIGQGSATGTFTDQTAFSGQFVFGVLGTDLNNFLPASLTSAGVFTADGQGNLVSGYNDAFLGGLFVRISDKFHGHYSVDPSGTGRVHSAIHFNNQQIPGPQLIFYLTGNGNPPLILHADDTNVTLGTGTAYPAAPQVAFSGKYGVGFTQNTLFGVENDNTGQITADQTAQTLSGIVDTNAGFVPLLDTVLTGTFTATDNAHRFKGTMVNEAFQANPDGIKTAYYLIDPDHGLFVETDSKETGQLTFGYFARRTSVCPNCP